MAEYTIGLRDMRLYAYHGVLPQENAVGNEYVVNCSVSFESAGISDNDLSQTISYVDLHTIISEEMAIPSKLLETVCHRIADRLRVCYPQITGGEIEITKTTPPIPGITASAYVRLTL